MVTVSAVAVAVSQNEVVELVTLLLVIGAYTATAALVFDGQVPLVAIRRYQVVCDTIFTGRV